MLDSFSARVEAICEYTEKTFNVFRTESFGTLSVYDIPSPINAGFGSDFDDVAEAQETYHRERKEREKKR